MKKWRMLWLSILLFPVLGILANGGGASGGTGGNGDTGGAGNGTGGEGGAGGNSGTEEFEIEIDGKKHKYTKDGIVNLHKELHTTKSQLGDTKKTLTDLQNKGKTEMEILQGQHTELQNNHRTVSKTNQGLMLELEAKTQGLEMEDAKEILIEDNDTRESIAKKVKEKKEKLDKRLEELMKQKGYAGSILKSGSKDNTKKVIDSIYGEDKDNKRKPRYEI